MRVLTKWIGEIIRRLWMGYVMELEFSPISMKDNLQNSITICRMNVIDWIHGIWGGIAFPAADHPVVLLCEDERAAFARS